MLSAGRAKSVLLPGQPTHQNPTARGIGAVKSNAPKGTLFARYAMALAAGKGNLHHSLEYAKTAFGKSSPEIAIVMPKSVSGAAFAIEVHACLVPNRAAIIFAPLRYARQAVTRVCPCGL